MSSELDISWQTLRQIVHDWAGSSAELTGVKPLAGGAINTTLLLETGGGEQAVIKISPYRVDRSYDHEASQLTLMRSLGLPTPQVYDRRVGTLDHPNSYILLEFLPGLQLEHAMKQCPADDADNIQAELAQMVLKLHHTTAEEYRRCTNFDEGFTNWGDFYRHVYDPVWKEMEQSPHLSVKQRKQIGKLHAKLDRYLQHSDCPRLVHWDLWSANILVNQNGDGKWHISAILDPMCKYAHADAEIAYLELFKTITPTFMKVYQAERKLSSEYHKWQKAIYQLYPLLNHVNLFGAEYVKPLNNVMALVSKMV